MNSGTGLGHSTPRADPDDGPPAPPTSGVTKRRRVLIGTVVVAVVLAAGGLTAARFVKSPAEKAAEAKAPGASVISSVVERRVLADTVVLRGTVTAGQTVSVAPQVSAGGGKDGGGVSKPVVTGVRVKAGDVLSAGQVLIEVSGRPVFVLPGELPVYRDLKPGSEGRDVEQVQVALAGLGHKVGSDKAGTFGAGTKSALAAFYRAAGYDAATAGEGAGESLRATEDRITSVERALALAKDALKAAQEVPAARSADPGSTAPPTGDRPAGQGTRAAEQQVRYATEDLTKARSALAELKAKSGAMLPAGEVVFLSKFPARVDTVQVAVGSEVKEKALTLSAGDLIVRGQLAPHEKGLVRAGLTVKILSELSGIEAAGEVRSVADVPASAGTEGADGSRQGTGSAGAGAAGAMGGQGYEVIVAPSVALDPTLAGQNVRLTVEAAVSDGPVLVVPLSAVSAGADGRTVVTVLGANGVRRRVEVRPGTSGDGYVEIRPLGDGALTDGDRVVVGAARRPTTSVAGEGARDGGSPS